MPHDPPAAYAGHLAGRRILVVEDNRLMAEELQHGLEDQGADVVGLAFTVDQALHYIDRHPYLDAVVLDVRLGEELSYPVADLLVERRVPFLFATAFPDWAIPSAYAGIARMRKPVDAAEVADVLVNAMS
jgi:DNA-binding response OmpR family regulator